MSAPYKAKYILLLIIADFCKLGVKEMLRLSKKKVKSSPWEIHSDLSEGLGNCKRVHNLPL